MTTVAAECAMCAPPRSANAEWPDSVNANPAKGLAPAVGKSVRNGLTARSDRCAASGRAATAIVGADLLTQAVPQSLLEHPAVLFVVLLEERTDRGGQRLPYAGERLTQGAVDEVLRHEVAHAMRQYHNAHQTAPKLCPQTEQPAAPRLIVAGAIQLCKRWPAATAFGGCRR